MAKRVGNDRPHKAAVNNGPWQTFPDKASAEAWVKRQIRNIVTDCAWVVPCEEATR